MLIVSSCRTGWNVEPALYGRPREPVLQPARHILQPTPVDQIASLIEGIDRPHPAECCDIGDRIVIAHDPFTPFEMPIEHAQHSLGLIDKALERPFVLDLAAREFVEVTKLPEERADTADLEEDPLDGLVAG